MYILFLSFCPDILLARQITRFFNTEYLWNGLMDNYFCMMV